MLVGICLKLIFKFFKICSIFWLKFIFLFIKYLDMFMLVKWLLEVILVIVMLL